MSGDNTPTNWARSDRARVVHGVASLNSVVIIDERCRTSLIYRCRLMCKQRGRPQLLVRVIDYTIDDGRVNDNVYQLITTILDPADVSAEDLALAYEQRWEIENVLDELKPISEAAHGAALEITEPCAARNLGALVLPLREPHVDVRSRARRER